MELFIFLTIINGTSMLILRDTEINKTRNCQSLVGTEMSSDKLPYIDDISYQEVMSLS